jgi:gluconolactonase
VEIAVSGLFFPEGTIFVGNSLYFVDYTRSSVLRLVGGKAETIWQQPGCGANGLLAVASGLLVACFDANAVIEISLTGATLGTIRQDDHGHALVAPNDFAADTKDGVYITASGSSATPGKVFYLGRDRAVREVASGVQFANGVGVSPDGGMLYVAESPTGKVLAFSVGADGSLGKARELIRLRDILPGAVTPDSLRVDKHGNLFVALYTGGGIAIVSPAGALIKLLDLPSAHHTNLAISPDGASLYVTGVDDDAQTTYRGEILRMGNPMPP